MNPVSILTKLPHLVRDSEYYITDPNYYPIYSSIVEKLAPTVVLEVGTFAGYSLVAMLCGSPNTIRTIIAIDNESRWLGSRAVCEVNVLRACEMLGRGPVKVYNFAGFDGVDYGLPVDLIHIDGDHNTAVCTRDIRRALVMQSQVILIDDVHDKSVREAVETVAKERGLMWVEMATLKGLGIFDFSEPDAEHLAAKYAGFDVEAVVHTEVVEDAVQITTDFPYQVEEGGQDEVPLPSGRRRAGRAR